MKVLAGLWIVILASAAAAQQTPGKSGVGLHLNASYLVGGTSWDSKVFAQYGVYYIHTFDRNYGMELSAYMGTNRPRNQDLSGLTSYFSIAPNTPWRTFMYSITTNFRWNFMPKERFNPYLVVGPGLLIWDLRNVSRENNTFPLPPSGTSASDYRVNVLENLGGGFEYFLNEDWAIDFSARFYHIINQQYDMSGRGDEQDIGMEARLGLSWYFGGWSDSDDDGIRDSEDRCPTRREDFDGFEDNDGCPDPDNDQDGILDVNDNCRQQPEDFDGYQDEDGCPDPDNDQDGIRDSADECPDQAEDMDGFEDQDGCPDTDNDGDGILDEEDECMNEPETFNGYQDKDGCPDEAPRVNVRDNTPTVLRGVNFPSGSTQLTQNAKRIIDAVVETLLDNREMRIEIGGFTDSRGDSNYNLQLSQKRANAVKEYIVRQGIEANRIVAVGYGEQEPIAPNTSLEGRAKNRRIEIIRID